MAFLAAKNKWSKISIPTKLYFLFGLMAILIVMELLAVKYAMSNLSAVRAFVYGESVWSKAQKDSVYYLQRMAITKDPKYYDSYRESLFVPLECRKARLELNKPDPRMDIVRRGFINGKIHPDEVDPILHMIRNFAWISHIQAALQTWKEADELLVEFEEAAVRYRDVILSPASDPKMIQKYSDEIHVLNLKLGKAEDRFSEALEEGARWLEKVVLISLVSLVVLVELIGFLLIYFVSKSLSSGLNVLIDSAEKIGRGEYLQDLPVNSEDEIGKLTESINKMSHMIHLSHAELERRIQDRTLELKHIAEENTKLYEEARQAVNMRDEFLSIAAHELKTPITAIQLSLQMMERKIVEKNEVDQQKLHSQIKKCVELSRKLTNMQDTLMDVTKISAGLFKVNVVENDLIKTVRNAIEDLSISEFNTEISIDGPIECVLNFDPTRINQVVTNLVRNALKYGGGSSVDVEVKDLEHEVHIYVKDKGKGIPLELHDKIFNQFTRAHSEEGLGGLGMGLYISREIMKAHGGSLKMLTSSEKGTTFQAALPK